MCTVSWLHDDTGYQLFCNRDEKRTRRPALPPRIGSRGGVRFVAPIDGDFGGTWIATNEFGISLCLLNGANLRHTQSQYGAYSQSRGLLLFQLIDASSIAAAFDRLSKADLSTFAAFTLALLEPGQQTAIAEWNGTEQRIVLNGESHLPLTSSSFDPEAVRAIRRQEYSRRNRARIEFHKSHEHGPSAYSPCMHRADAETVSFSRITVNESEANFFYSPDAPCKESPGGSTILARRQ